MRRVLICRRQNFVFVISKIKARSIIRAKFCRRQNFASKNQSPDDVAKPRCAAKQLMIRFGRSPNHDPLQNQKQISRNSPSIKNRESASKLHSPDWTRNSSKIHPLIESNISGSDNVWAEPTSWQSHDVRALLGSSNHTKTINLSSRTSHSSILTLTADDNNNNNNNQ
jgi:hypothetical protein